MRIKHPLVTALAFALVISLSACLMPTRVAPFATSTTSATAAATLGETVASIVLPTQADTPTLPAPTATETQPPTATATEVMAATTQPTSTVQAPQPSQTQTPQPALTPVEPVVSARMNTNCRLGPSPEYRIVGSLVVGESARVAGRSSPRGWWYIENPSFTGYYCWVWGLTTEVEGDVESLRIVTAEPAPTPTRNQ